MKTELDYLKELIDGQEKELVKSQVMEWVYNLEVADPKHLGKQKAMDALGTYQKHTKYVEQNIEVYKKYAREKNYDI